MYGVRSTKGRSRDFGESKVFDLSDSGIDEGSGLRIISNRYHSPNELSHRGDSMFNRSRAVRAVEVIKIDVIHSQPRQGLIEGLVDIFWIAPYHPIGTTTSPGTELCSEKDLVALPSLFKPKVSNHVRTTVRGAEPNDRRVRTISQAILRCRRRCQRCPRKCIRTRKQHPEPVVAIRVNSITPPSRGTRGCAPSNVPRPFRLNHRQSKGPCSHTQLRRRSYHQEIVFWKSFYESMRGES